jgi:hypothetical protein
MPQMSFPARIGATRGVSPVCRHRQSGLSTSFKSLRETVDSTSNDCAAVLSVFVPVTGRFVSEINL